MCVHKAKTAVTEMVSVEEVVDIVLWIVEGRAAGPRAAGT